MTQQNNASQIDPRERNTEEQRDLPTQDVADLSNVEDEEVEQDDLEEDADGSEDED